MSRIVRIVVSLALVYFAVGGLSLPSLPKATPQVVTSEPSPTMKVQVQPIVRIVRDMSPLDRLWLQYIYSNAAKVVEADGISEPPVVTTTEGLRAIHVAILKFIWKGMAENPPGKYAGLKEAIESVFKDTIGDTQRAITPELRKKASEMFDAIAWAGLGKDG